MCFEIDSWGWNLRLTHGVGEVSDIKCGPLSTLVAEEVFCYDLQSRMWSTFPLESDDLQKNEVLMNYTVAF